MPYKHGGKGTRLYRIWLGMRRRCNCVTDAAYHRYGGRGIGICTEWDEFDAFRDWATANGYASHLTIDRADNDKGYDPSNCRWATYRDQNRNYSRNRPVQYDGRTALIGDFAAEHGLPADVVKNRVMRYGWPMEKALTTPVRKKIKREPWAEHDMSRSTFYRAKRDGRV